MNHLSKVRKSLGLTQNQLALMCGWKQSRIANYEIGIRKPGLDECRTIIGVLNEKGAKCSLDTVFPPLTGLNHEPTSN